MRTALALLMGLPLALAGNSFRAKGSWVADHEAADHITTRGKHDHIDTVFYGNDPLKNIHIMPEACRKGEDTCRTDLLARWFSDLVPKVPSPPTNVSQVIDVLETLTAKHDWQMPFIDYTTSLLSHSIWNGTFSRLQWLASIPISTGVTESGVFAPSGSSNENPLPSNYETYPWSIWPKAERCDPEYSIPESSLRGSIYIPSTFTRGKKRPVILFPGMGNTGYSAFASTLIPFLTDVDWADPVWINPPDHLLGNAYEHMEFAAYAVHYIATITGRTDIGVIAWGTSNAAWQGVYKWWPSVRPRVTDHIAISGNFKGSRDADILVRLGLPTGVAGAIHQQKTGSQFIRRIRALGDKAIVNTTSIYSSRGDMLVSPQDGGKHASAYLEGAENVEVQQVCGGKGLAGGLYTHEGLLANPLTFAMVKDALTHDGPGRVERLKDELDTICKDYLAPGLDVEDLLVAQNAILYMLFGMLGTPSAEFEHIGKSYAATGQTTYCMKDGTVIHGNS